MTGTAARSRPLLIAACLAAVYVVWSSTYLALRYVVEAFPALLSSGTRYLCAGALLYGAARLAGGPRPRAAHWRAAIPTGALLCVVGNGFVSLAEREVSSSLAAVACAAMPIFACLFDAFGGARPSVGEWAGVLVGFAGVAVLGVAELRARPLAGTLLLLAPIGWAAGSVLTRRLPRAPGLMGPATQLVCGGAVCTVVAFAAGERWPSSWPAAAIGSWLYLVLFGSVIAFSSYSWLLAHATTALATSYAYVNPVLAVLLGVLVGHEHVGGSVATAAGLVVAGVALTIHAGRRRS